MSSSANCSSISSILTRTYDELPPEAQRSLMLKLLDVIPAAKAQDLLALGIRTTSSYAQMPLLNYEAKQREIDGLLEEMGRDIKLSIVKGRSNHDALLKEVVDSILDWIPDIWTVIHDFNVHFQLAHKCLLYLLHALNVLGKIRNLNEGCQCPYTNMRIGFTLRDAKGRRVKQFQFTGGSQIDAIMLWMWRELFVTMLKSHPKPQNLVLVAEMLHNIEEESPNPTAFEQMLNGDKSEVFDEIDDTEEEPDDYPFVHSFKTAYWDKESSTAFTRLKVVVTTHLMNQFSLSPSLFLFKSIRSIDPSKTSLLLETLNLIAPCTSDTLCAALTIFAAQGQLCTTELASLITPNPHILNTNNKSAMALQAAVTCLSSSSKEHHTLALQVLERELLKTAHDIRSALSSFFPSIHSRETLDKLVADVFSMQQRFRSDAVDTWVSEITPENGPNVLDIGNPMLMAAALMGLPIPINADDIDDGLGMLDVERDDSGEGGGGTNADPDLDDIVEEFRPRLRLRWETWVTVAGRMKGGSTVLARIYSKLVSKAEGGMDMLYIKGWDVMEELMTRLSDKPSKQFLYDALDVLNAFSRRQRQRIEKKRKAEAKEKEKSAAASETTTIRPATGSVRAVRTMARRTAEAMDESTDMPPLIGSTNSVAPSLFPIGDHPGGLEDVD